ncbi:hypothetical protein EJB05_33516 [Eragrostis curvula]|uniref:F-box domain-containing protein n=1 Tax=Eragrostis curvula TaxID=38414 RepID=A0A5J9U2P4_9POAL|nr:hypothetical protein EJB05_33516 [Eragrostis curvula]
MSRLRRPTTSPGALDSDDILADVVLRLPPRPCFLPRAGFVCKHWRRLVMDPEFLRRFRARHGTPPLLGFFLQDASFVPTLDPPDRVSASRLSLDRRDCESRRWGWELRSCLHGLLLCENAEEFLVHDPVAGDRIRVPFPHQDRVPITAALLAAGGDSERRWFNLVALITDDSRRRMSASVYSSDSGVWVDSAATFPLPSYIHLPSTTVGNATYWLFDGGILKFDLGTRKLLRINSPTNRSVAEPFKCKIVPAGKEGQFGLAVGVLDEPTIRFLEWKTDPNGAEKWVLRKTVHLDNSLPLQSDTALRLPRILGFAEGSNIIFLGTRLGIFMINLNSMQFRKVLDGNNVSYIFPYSSFLSAGRCLTGTASATFPPTQASKLQFYAWGWCNSGALALNHQSKFHHQFNVSGDKLTVLFQLRVRWIALIPLLDSSETTVTMKYGAKPDAETLDILNTVAKQEVIPPNLHCITCYSFLLIVRTTEVVVMKVLWGDPQEAVPRYDLLEKVYCFPVR